MGTPLRYHRLPNGKIFMPGGHVGVMTQEKYDECCCGGGGPACGMFCSNGAPLNMALTVSGNAGTHTLILNYSEPFPLPTYHNCLWKVLYAWEEMPQLDPVKCNRYPPDKFYQYIYAAYFQLLARPPDPTKWVLAMGTVQVLGTGCTKTNCDAIGSAWKEEGSNDCGGMDLPIEYDDCYTNPDVPMFDSMSVAPA